MSYCSHEQTRISHVVRAPLDNFRFIEKDHIYILHDVEFQSLTSNHQDSPRHSSHPQRPYPLLLLHNYSKSCNPYLGLLWFCHFKAWEETREQSVTKATRSYIQECNQLPILF